MSLGKRDWRFDLPPTLEAVEQFCEEFRRWRTATCANLDPFSTELLLREALTNAVRHGCSENTANRVFCVIRAKRGSVTIAIRDEGEGFDWRAAWSRQSAPWEDHGRGIEIFRLYANFVRFNAKGNAVTLIKRFDRGNQI